MARASLFISLASTRAGVPVLGESLTRFRQSRNLVALTLLKGNLKALTLASLPLMQQLVQTRSWWDTVDVIASHPVGSLILRSPELKAEMDTWSRHPDFWLRRTSLLHQLGYKARTDAKRLFRYCLDNAADQEFFIRKAIGWALREYAKTDPQAVYTFVDNHRDHLSTLSIREALKHRQPPTKLQSATAGLFMLGPCHG